MLFRSGDVGRLSRAASRKCCRVFRAAVRGGGRCAFELLIYRDEYYNKDSEFKKQAEIIIAKQRNGPVGTVNLAWLGEYTKFANLSRQEDSF